MTVKYKITAKPDINFCVLDTSAEASGQVREGGELVPNPAFIMASRAHSLGPVKRQPDSSVSHCGIE